MNKMNLIYIFLTFADLIFLELCIYGYLYRVFKKEGGKVKGYYTAKKCILGVHSDHKNGTFGYLHQFLIFFYIKT